MVIITIIITIIYVIMNHFSAKPIITKEYVSLSVLEKNINLP